MFLSLAQMTRKNKKMTAKEYLFSKYPNVSPEWFDENELTQEMIKMMESYASEQIEKYKELIEVMDKLYEVSCDALYEHKIDPTGEMGKLYIKTQLLKTELGL